MSIILIGYRGSGKSTIGKRLADKLWSKFVDTDQLVAKTAGRTIKEIFESGGEKHFRDLEVAAVKDALSHAEHVIGLGGGAVTREENRAAVKASGRKVVYLRCDPKVLHERIQNDPTSATTRPNLTAHGGTIDEITTLIAEREPLYRSLMNYELDVTNLSPDEAVVYISRQM